MKRQLIKPSESRTVSTRCSFFDSLCVFALPSSAFAYPERLDVARLRRALALILDDFSSFAGRFVQRRDAWYIDHGAGVVFETAERPEPNRALELMLRTGHSDVLCPRLSAMAVRRGEDPLFAARLTHTADGSVLGVTWSHTLGDYHSVMLLLHAWALAYRDRPYEKPLEVVDRGAYLDQHAPAQSSDAPAWRLLPWSECVRGHARQYGHGLVARRVAIDFSWSQVSAMQAAVGPGVSPGMALCAHIFSALGALDDVGREFTVAINYRKTFGLPPNLVGNASDFVRAVADRGDSPAAIASGLRGNIGAFACDSLSQHQLQRLRAAHPHQLDMLRFWGPGEPGRINLGLTNVSRMGCTQLAFGTTLPAFVYMRATDSLPIGAGSIFESSHDTGLTLDIALPPKLIERVANEHGWLPS